MIAWKLKVTDVIASADSVRCFLFVAPSPDHTYQRCGELSLTLVEAQDLQARLSEQSE